MHMNSLLFMAVSAGFLAVPSVAQDLTDQEIAERFAAQRAATNPSSLGQTRSILGNPTTRGVTFVTLGEEQTTGAEVSATPAPADPNSSLDPNKPLVAVRFEEELTVDVRIDFAFDSAVIEDNQKPALDQICRVMAADPNIETMRIAGHTDSSGSDEYNARLSRLRAEEVGRYLTDECGIAGSRIQTVGYGEQFLADTEDPESAKNRRVEFQSLSS